MKPRIVVLDGLLQIPETYHGMPFMSREMLSYTKEHHVS